MSTIDITIPSVGESITEATIEEWFKQSGDYVEKEDVIVSLETDKASVEITAEASGVLTISAEEGDTLEIGAKIGSIDSSKQSGASNETSEKNNKETSEGESGSGKAKESQTSNTNDNKGSDSTSTKTAESESSNSSSAKGIAGPAAKHILGEKGLNESDVEGTGPKGNITKADAQNAKASEKGESKSEATSNKKSDKTESSPSFESRESRKVKMTTLRKRIAERLVQAQQTAAILTTFNEVDMTEVMSLRSKYKEDFEKKFDTRLGFMGLFVKATCEALKDFPAVNAFIEDDSLIYNDFVNMGIAVGGPKGLVVPVIKDADLKGLHHIESEIRGFAQKAQNNKLTIDDLTGGTFTISNGGVYGSLMSTPILNPPQSAILGMHSIQERPMVVDGEIKIRPMMYLALSYDHRVIDGKESVSFLVKIKERLEDPRRLILGV